MDHDPQLEVRLVPRALLEDFTQLALDFHAHGEGALDLAPALAIRAIVVYGRVDTLRVALARHLHQAKLRDGQHVGLGLVTPQAFFHALIDLLLVPARLHVNVVEHDEPTHVAQAQLAGDFVGGLEVYLEDRGFLVLAALVAAGVYVNGHQGLGLVHNDIAAALEMHLPGESVLQLPGDIEAVEDRLRVGVELDFAGGALGDLGDHLAHAVVGLRAVHHDALDVFRQKVAHRAFDQIRLLENAARQRAGLDALLDLGPLLEQEGEVAHEIPFLLPFTHRAHDHAHAIGDGEFAQDLLQPQALLLVFDLAGDAALVRIRKQDQVTARQDHVRGDAWAFCADWPLGHLGDDFTARGIKAGDVFLGDLGLLASAAAAIHDLHPAVEAVRHDVPVVEKGVLLEPDIHKGGLEAILEIAHPSFEDAADQPLLGRALDGKLLEPALLGHGDAGLEGFGVNDNLLVDFLHRLDQPLDPLHQAGCRRADGLHDSLRLLLELDGRKGLLFLHLGGRLHVWLPKIALLRQFLRFPWQPFRRQACRDVLRPLDFVGVALLIQFL